VYIIWKLKKVSECWGIVTGELLLSFKIHLRYGTLDM
jgi:hypothetical protein